MSNPNTSPLTNPVGPNDLIRVIQEGCVGHSTPRQLAMGLPGAFVLAQSAAPASVTGTTVETVLATVVIPPLGANSAIRITTQYSFSGGNGNRNVNVRLNGVQARQFLVAATVMSAETVTTIRNRGVASQTVFGLGQAGSGSATGSPVSLTADTSVPTTLTLLGSPVSAADSVTLEGYTVEILTP